MLTCKTSHSFLLDKYSETWGKWKLYNQLPFLLISCFIFLATHACPDICKCNGMEFGTSDGQDVIRKVVCSSVRTLFSINDSRIQSIPNSTVNLILRENGFSVVPSFGLTNLPLLKKLDLSRNNISEIQQHAFDNLTSLEKLDLSYNKIATLLSNVFHPLTALSRLDLSNNLLNCDCNLKWLIEWSRSNKIHISSKTTCHFPKAFAGVPLIHIAKDLHCNRSIFELFPSVPQLVFEGDSFSFYCRASKEDHNIEMTWMLNDKMLPEGLEGKDDGIAINTATDRSVLHSSLRIGKIKSIHSGFWRCHVNSTKSYKSTSVELLVLSNDGEFCPRSTSSGNRGDYEWPETPVGVTVELECSTKRTSQLISYPRAFAYRTCTRPGIWQNLNASSCPYISEVTNILEQFSKSNISFSPVNILDSARLLQNYTKENNLLTDKMDVVFISRILQNYLLAVPRNNEVADIIVDIINTLMYLNKDVLNAAELEDQACTKVLTIIEQLSELLMDLPLSHITGNIVVEDFFVKSDSFPGITCFSFLKNNYVYNMANPSEETKNSPDKKFLNCNIASSFEVTELDESIEGSLRLPSTLFQQSLLDSLAPPTYKLQFIIFRNSLLFPREITGYEMSDVTSSIISGKIAHKNFHNLSEPVIVSLRTAAYTEDVKPVWWDPSAMGGKGDWSDDGCSVIKVHRNIVTFSCDRLATFGLLQNIDAFLAQYSFEKAQFRLPHPAIFVGSIFCVTPLVATLFAYCIAYKSLKMSNKMKHSTANTFLSLMLLCLTFALGISQTDIVPICQGIGFLLHYFTLCTLFWMLVTASNMYKKLSKSESPETTSSENLPIQPLPPKPMLRFYLIGWGISAIICGISAAVDIGNYGGIKCCFLSLSQSLGALCGPSLFLLFLLCSLYLHIYCTIRHKYFDQHFKDDVSVQLVNIPEITCGNNKRCNSFEEESIQLNELQLRGNSTLLLIYIFTWLSAYSTIGRPFENFFSHDELLFALLYCIFSSILGVYSFIFFCCLRVDTCTYFCICKIPAEDKEVSEIFPMTENSNILIQNTVAQDNKSCSTSEKITAHTDSGTMEGISMQVTSDGQSTKNMKVFFDPRQNELARRFFEKNRRQQQTQKVDLELCTRGKYERNSNDSFSKSSNSSQINMNNKSEHFKGDKSSPSQNSDRFQLSKKNYLQSKENSDMYFKCQYFGKSMCHSLLSDSGQMQTSALCHSCCSNIGSDSLSNVMRHHRQHSRRHHLKCCHSRYSPCSKAKKNEGGASYSAEDLKQSCQCLNEPYTECCKSSSNMYALHSNSDITVMSCKFTKEK